MAVIVKRKGRLEKFDDRKTYGSVYAACASAHYSEDLCEDISSKVTKLVKGRVKGKKQVKSLELRKLISKALKDYSDELAFFYEAHLPNLKKL